MKHPRAPLYFSPGAVSSGSDGFHLLPDSDPAQQPSGVTALTDVDRRSDRQSGSGGESSSAKEGCRTGPGSSTGVQESVAAQQQQTLKSGRQHSSRLDYKPSPFPYTMQRSGLGDVSSIAASDDKCTDNDSTAELSLASNRNSARQPVAVLSETWQEAETQAKAALKLADTLLESRLEDRELAAATQEKWLAGGHCCRVWRCILFRCAVLTPCCCSC